MRARTSASHDCGSMSFIFAVTIRLYMAAARVPPRSEPANNHVSSSCYMGGASSRRDAGTSSEVHHG